MEVKKYNYNIALLKIFFSYCVVLCHYWNPDFYAQYPAVVDITDRLRRCAVPIFVMISFYLTEKTYSEFRIGKFKERIKIL